MDKTENSIPVSPIKITQLLHASWAMRALAAGVELDIFAPMQAGPKDASTIAEELGLNAVATEILLDAITAIELLEKCENKYVLSKDARVYLAPQSQLDLSKWVRLNEKIENSWKKVADTIRTGHTQEALDTQTKADEFYPELTEAVFPLGYVYAQRLAKYLNVVQLPMNSRVLDLAAGAATWSIPMVEQNADLHVDALDFESTLAVTKRFVQKFSLSDNYEYLAGDWRNMSLEDDSYDIVILGHILHLEGWENSKEMIERCYRATKPGGRIVIVEYIANNERSGPLQPMVFGVYMRMLTEVGYVFSEAELAKLLMGAGFKNARLMPDQSQALIMLANK